MHLIARPGLPVAIPVTAANSDDQIVALWVSLQHSPHTRRNFRRTAEAFLSKLGRPLLGATLEEVLAALVAISDGLSAATARQYTARVKSLLSFATTVRYLPANVGAAIRGPKAPDNLAQRILAEQDVEQLLGLGSTARDGLMLALTYGVAVRISELVGLSVRDVIKRSDETLQVSVLGKGGKVRQVVVPDWLTARLLATCAGRPPESPLFLSREHRRLSTSAAYRAIKKAVARAGINPAASPHWLRHAHAGHAMDHGAGVHEVQQTLGHENLSTTSRYIKARPNVCTGNRLKAGSWK